MLIDRARAGKRTPEQVRDDMIEFCRREIRNGDANAYISALTSAAHLCDQVAREASRKAVRDAAKDCGDFIWRVADEMKLERAKKSA